MSPKKHITSNTYTDQQKKKVVSAMRSIATKIEHGEFLVEMSGLYEKDGKWTFRVVVVPPAVEVPFEQ